MRQRKQTTPARAANDNAGPARATIKNMAHGQGDSHLYVQEPKKHDAEHMAKTRARGTWERVTVYTDLPESLPVLPEEIALIRGFMGDLVSRIIANDNEPV